MKEIGTAIAVDGNKVKVSVKRTAACDRCGRCAHAHITFGDNGTLTVEAISAGDVKPGDVVELDMDSGQFLKASSLVWLLPLAAAGAGYGFGYLLGNVLGPANLWAGAFSVSFFGLSFVWLHQYDKASSRAGRYMPLARPLRETHW